jgi:RsiW-degrading membrane proteinase PrsW (M82 family)
MLTPRSARPVPRTCARGYPFSTVVPVDKVRTSRRFALPTWLSWPVVVSAVPVGLVLFLGVLTNPFVVALTLVPGSIVMGSFLWLDRVEPEPWSERLHAFLWGATVSALVAVAANEFTSAQFGASWALVVSAPLVEETMKALGLVVAARRHHLRNWFDGAVYAGFVATGFALVENVAYFLNASDSADLVAVFMLRGLATPFAHPLFTVFTGMVLGRFYSSRRPVAYLGLPVAITVHAGWNAASLTDEMSASLLLIGAFVLFWVVFVSLLVIRIRSTRGYRSVLPLLAFRVGLDPFELDLLSDWQSVLRARKGLPAARRAAFEDLHRAVRRLVPFAARRTDPPEGLVADARLACERFRGRLPPPTPSAG